MHRYHRARRRISLTYLMIFVIFYPCLIFSKSNLKFPQPYKPTRETITKVCSSAQQKRGQKTNALLPYISHICYLNISILRQKDCSLSITETIILPYSVKNGLPDRPIAVLSKQQLGQPLLKPLTNLSNDTKESTPRKTATIDEYQYYSLNTPNSRTAIPLIFKYHITNGVYHFTQSCNLEIEPGKLFDGLPKDRNIIRYRFENWKINIYESEITLRGVSSKSEFNRTIGRNPIRWETNLIRTQTGPIPNGSLFEKSFLEANLKSCKADFECFKDPIPVLKIVFIALGGVILLIFLLCVVFCGIRRKRSGFGYNRRNQTRRNATQTQLPDEFNAEDRSVDTRDEDPPSTSTR